MTDEALTRINHKARHHNNLKVYYGLARYRGSFNTRTFGEET